MEITTLFNFRILEIITTTLSNLFNNKTVDLLRAIKLQKKIFFKTKLRENDFAFVQKLTKFHY